MEMSSSSSASHSPPCEPAAGGGNHNPSGSGSGSGSGRWQKGCPSQWAGEPVEATMCSGSRLGTATATTATAEATTDQVRNVSNLDLAIMACDIGLLVAIVFNLGALTLTWPTLCKVLYGSVTVVSFVSVITAFLTAWCPAIAWARRLSPSCARFSVILAAALFVVLVSCKLTPFGCVGGVAAAAVVVVILPVIWVLSDLAETDAAAAAAEEGASDSLPPDVP